LSDAAQDTLQIEVTDQTVSGRLAIRMTGELGLASIGMLEEQLQKLVDEITEPLQITFDLGDLTFVDSSGLKVLLRWSQNASESGGALAISAASEPVRRVIEVAGVTDALSLPD
jgi:anti-anti-sigma factor